jgi:uncharacterized membrane protein
MRTERLNAFTDGVLAIVITIMVLELPTPHSGGIEALRPMLPLFAAYALSFVNVGIFWNNHHHLMTTAKRIDGRVMWANLLLLFWLSLVPFVIRWMGEHGVTSGPAAAYGIVLVAAALTYILLEWTIALANPEIALRDKLGGGIKEVISLLLYAAGIGLSFVRPMVAVLCYVLVAAAWFLPDPRIERSRDPS